MKRISLKLWSGMMVLVAVVLILLWLFQIVFLEHFYKNIKIAKLIRSGKEMITLIESAGGLEEGLTDQEVQNQLEGFVYVEQLSLELADTKGNIIYQADYNKNQNGRGFILNATSQVYQAALSGSIAKLEIEHPRFANTFMVIGLPITIKNSVTGVMILYLPLAPVKETASILQQQLLFITAILLFVALLITYYLSKAFTRPIIQIHQLAESYSEGNFERRIKVKSSDEIGLLAKRMNKMGEELAKNDQLRKELIANVSHELRTPISLIRGYAETLRDVTGENPVKREKQLGVIIDETERLTRIVEDILSFSRYQAGVITLDRKAFSLNQMLLEVMKRYDTDKSLRTISLTGLEKEDIIINADQGRIEQVVYNLINNAIHHTGEDGKIELRITKLQETVRIEVIDNGEGIEEQELPNIFDRYYKGKKTQRNIAGGTGLGLAIVKSILQLHQVSFGVKSQIGIGTNFWFELPCAL